jgi:hypothetical protein
LRASALDARGISPTCCPINAQFPRKRCHEQKFTTASPRNDHKVGIKNKRLRAGWDEDYNTLKTKGYNLEHNFGHGKQHLASFLATLQYPVVVVSHLVGTAG